MEIRTAPLFEKHYKQLPERVKDKAKQKEKVFRANPFHPSLKTHKLSGKEKEVWAFWVSDSYRVKFVFLPNQEVLFLDIGTHEIYK